MKRIFLLCACIFAIDAGFLQISHAQVMLQKAVISNGGAIATNGSTNGAFVVGQTATGVAANSQMTGHFGFFAAPNAASSVPVQGAGMINSLALSPNPASDEVGININLVQSENVDIFLYDASGHLVSTIFSGKKEAGSFTQRMDVKSLASGAYFVAARIPGALVQAKLDVIR
jgi:hypothetical protein